MKKTLGAVLFGLAIAVSGGAAATTYRTDTPGVSALTTGAALYCNASGCTSTLPADMAGYATLTAWSTQTLAANNSTSPDDTGFWVAAKIALYSGGGIGITNVKQSGTAETDSPQHGIDNKKVDDILVVDFGSSGWDVNSFTLGYKCAMNNSSPTGCVSGGSVSTQAWLGGGDGVTIDFTTQSFNANGLAAMPTLGSFTSLALSPDGVTSTPATINDSSSSTGRYLVITGALGPGSIDGTTVTGHSDSFKVKEIVATKTTNVPSPGSLPLVALGLLALTFAYRRVATAKA